jgi:CBS domain-containing protein
MQVQDIMSREPIVVHEDTPLDAIARIMLEHRIGCVPVVDEGGDLRGIVTEADFTGTLKRFPVVRDGKVVGIVSRHDLLRVLAGEGAGAVEFSSALSPLC